MNKPPQIDTINKVREKNHLLDVLKEIDVTNKYLNLLINVILFNGR